MNKGAKTYILCNAYTSNGTLSCSEILLKTDLNARNFRIKQMLENILGRIVGRPHLAFLNVFLHMLQSTNNASMPL